MEMFRSLKSSLTPLSQSVSSALQDTVYNTGQLINGVIPGNPVTREYEIKQRSGSAGPNLLWTIYTAVKKSSGQAASVWVLTRANLDTKYDKQDRDIIWEVMKKGVSQLTRLRHPSILTVEHPLEESRDCLAFATEPVLASLSNLILQDNLSSELPEQILSYKLEPLEIKYGLLQVAEGLGFLHNSARLLHRDICLESIIVNNQGAWKISGFEYSLTSKPGTGAAAAPSWDPPDYDQTQPVESYPNLDYSAPELAQETGEVTTSADMFSFGMIAYTVHTKKTLYQTNRNWQVFKRNALDLRTPGENKLTSLPNDLKESVKMLISRSYELRPSPGEIQQLQYFQDVGVQTLQKLDSQFQLDNLQKSHFFKGLINILPQLPTRVLIHRVYPCLSKEFVNATMVPFLLPSVFNIIQRSNSDDFAAYILPNLKPVMQLLEPVQILLIFMQNMEHLLDKTPAQHLKSDVLPMLYRALQADDAQIQELCLSILPDFSGRLEPGVLKTGVIPRIRQLCLNTRLLSVRVNCLVTVGKMMDHLDKWQVIDDILPMIFQLPSREPAIIMASVGVFKVVLNNPKLGLSKEVMATKVLPFLLPLCIENSLSLAQFESVMHVIKDMTTRVETEQRNRITQVKVSSDEQKLGKDAQDVFNTKNNSDFAGFDEGTRTSSEVKTSGGQNSSSASLSLQQKQAMFRGQQDTKSVNSNIDWGSSKSPNQNSSKLLSTNNNMKTSNYNVTASTPSINTSLPNTKSTHNDMSSLQSINNFPTTGGGSMLQPASFNMLQSGGFNQFQQPTLQSMPGVSHMLQPAGIGNQYRHGGSMVLQPGGGNKMLQPNVNNQASGNNSGKQLSMAEINDLLS